MERNLKAKFLTAAVAENEEGKPLVRVQFKAWDTEAVIYRMEAPGFVFDFHYREYFDDFSVKNAEIVWKGAVYRNGNWCTYEDYEVELHKVYVYWVTTPSEPEKVTGPVTVKIRDRAVWWSFEKVLRETDRLAGEFAGVDTVQVGETVQHKPLVALRAGNPDKVVALIGSVHAGEGGPEVWLRVVRNILENHPRLLERVGIALLPSVNADAREEMVCGTPWYIRKNVNGVDLNRNFDVNWQEVSAMYGCRSDEPRDPTYRGVRPASEPETRAVVRFLELVQPQVCLSAHSMSSIPGDVLLCAGIAEGDAEYLERAGAAARAYKEGYRRILNWPVKTPMVYGTTQGSLPAYAYTKGIVCFDMEHANGVENNPFDDSKQDLATKEMIDLCVRCHTEGVVALLNHLGECGEKT